MHRYTCKCRHSLVVHDYEIVPGLGRDNTYCHYPECNCVKYEQMPLPSLEELENQVEMMKIANEITSTL